MSGAVQDLLRQGREQEARGEWEQAVDTYRQAILADPHDVMPYACLGSVLYVAGFVEPIKDTLGWNPLVFVVLGWWVLALVSRGRLPTPPAPTASRR